MLDLLQAAIDRLSHAPSRAAELRILRRRFDEARGQATTCPDEQDELRSLAGTLRGLRKQLSAALPADSPCSSCSAGCVPAGAPFAGGDCCRAATADVFSDEEVLALTLAGTKSKDLVAPRTEHQGCAFRGERGCSLEPEHRPSICVVYTCRELRRHLLASDEFLTLKNLVNELTGTLEEFGQLQSP